MKISETHKIEIEVLSPLHIGTGVEMEYDLDFVWHNGRLHVIDADRYFSDNPAAAEAGFQGFSKLLRPNDYARYERYSLPSSQRPAKLRATMRSAEGDVYLPGSTLKGAIRTAILSGMMKEAGGIQPRDVGDRPASAAREIERRFLGRDPQHDLLRALRISDAKLSRNYQAQATRVTLYSLKARTLVPKGSSYEWLAEVILPGTTFQASLTLDRYLLTGARIAPSYGATDQLVKDFKRKATWLDNRLFESCNANSHYLAGRERSFFESFGPRDMIDFYQALEKQILEEAGNGTSAFLNLGWSTGWHVKTVSNALESEPGLLDNLRRNFRMGRQGFPFPKTRRLVGGIDNLLQPLGWIKMTRQ